MVAGDFGAPRLLGLGTGGTEMSQQLGSSRAEIAQRLSAEGVDIYLAERRAEPREESRAKPSRHNEEPSPK